MACKLVPSIRNLSYIVAVVALASAGSQGCRLHEAYGEDGDSETMDKKHDAGDLDAGGKEELRIYDLHVLENPNNALSCFVSWRTNRPASSSVEALGAELGYRFPGEETGTEHRLLVIGLHAEHEYRLRALATAAGETAIKETSFTTGALPDVIPVAILGADDYESMQPGWTLTNISDQTSSPPAPCVVVMYDESGRPVWYFINGDEPDTRGDIDVRYLGGGVLIGPSGEIEAREVDLTGNVLWEGPPQNALAINFMSHHFEKLETGNYLAIRDIQRNDILGNLVEEIAPDWGTLWQWVLFDHLAPSEGASWDWCHANSVTLIPEEDLLYLSCRNLDAVLKISLLGAQDIVWRLGEGGDFAPDPFSADPWFLKQHDPELQENGNILIYDNGGVNEDIRGHSRVVEYALDEEAMESFIVWEFPGNFKDVDPWYTDNWYTPIWGDADRLENGNVLVAAGTRNLGKQSRIFEVTPDGQVVWDIRLPRSNRQAIGLYRAERMPLPEIMELVPERTSEISGTVHARH